MSSAAFLQVDRRDDKASGALKACVPRFEMSGNEVAVFQLDNSAWRFVSYLNPEEIPASAAQ